MIVDVRCEDDTIQIAKLETPDPNNHQEVGVRFLRRVKSSLYNFEDEITTVPRESLCGWYDTENLEDTELYVKTVNGYDLVDDSEDENFVYSEGDEEESESESLVDEDEA